MAENQQTAAEIGVEPRVVDPTASVGTDNKGNLVNKGGQHAEAKSSMDSDPGQPIVAPGAERPSWLPEGVNTMEELDAWYKANREDPNAGKMLVDTEVDPDKALDQKPAAEESDKEDPPKPKTEEPKVPTDDEIRERLKAAGGIYADPKYEPYALEFEKTGAISPESLTKAAADFGVSEDLAKAFFDGQLAQRELQKTTQQVALTEAQQKMAAAIVSVMPDGYENMIKWAASPESSIDADTKAAYDAALDRGDTATVKVILKALNEAYQLEVNGVTDHRDITDRAKTGVDNPPQASPEVKPFGSRQEAEAAMGSRRYATNPSYRAEVDARYIASSFDR